MFQTLNTLLIGASNRTEARVRDHFAIELIDQKIREAEAHVTHAKAELAMLIQRQRREAAMLAQVTTRITDLETRARAALADGREDLATEAAGAIADLEGEQALRQETTQRLDMQVLRLRQSVEAGHRRVVDLKQGAVRARALKRDHDAQVRLRGTAHTPAAAREAQQLINQVLDRADPLEQAEILDDIDAGLERRDVAERLGEAGYGTPTKPNAAAVLARLKAAPAT